MSEQQLHEATVERLMMELADSEVETAALEQQHSNKQQAKTATSKRQMQQHATTSSTRSEQHQGMYNTASPQSKFQEDEDDFSCQTGLTAVHATNVRRVNVSFRA
jgi:hypothetical protein